MSDSVQTWLTRFGLDESLRDHIAHVLLAMPEHVRDELMNDSAFSMCDYEPVLGMGYQVSLASPGRDRSSRAVVLKRTLGHTPPAFVRWVIAHELAHAHLRNGGRWDGDDPEHAADALAAQWGFPRPPRR
ncbi:MAG: hypothetical protein WD042_08040 [Phycisphaeraceae bacterium]